MNPRRTVSIVKDPCAALWFLMCAEPCRPDGWCMEMHHGRPGCYLAGAMTPDGARRLADRYGFEVRA